MRTDKVPAHTVRTDQQTTDIPPATGTPDFPATADHTGPPEAKSPPTPGDDAAPPANDDEVVAAEAARLRMPVLRALAEERQTLAKLSERHPYANYVSEEEAAAAAHADPAEEEWPGTRELAAEQAAHCGVRFDFVKRPQGGILQHVLDRHATLQAKGKADARPWPDSRSGYPTHGGGEEDLPAGRAAPSRQAWGEPEHCGSLLDLEQGVLRGRSFCYKYQILQIFPRRCRADLSP